MRTRAQREEDFALVAVLTAAQDLESRAAARVLAEALVILCTAHLLYALRYAFALAWKYASWRSR